MRHRIHLILPILINLLAASIYFYTSPQSFFWLDSLNFVSAAATFGITLPPAPLYVFVAHLFTLLPFGTVIDRVQLLSIVMAIISLCFVYWTITRLIRAMKQDKETTKENILSTALPGVFGLFALAFTYQFWLQSQNPEKWIFECAIAAIVIYICSILVASKRNPFPIIYPLGFLLGLSLGLDPVVISFFPAVAIMLLIRKQQKNIAHILGLATTVIIGVFLAYLYLPIASATGPFMNWGNPTDFASIWAVATGQGQNSSTTGFTGSFEVYLNSAGRYFVMLWQNFTPLLLPFIGLGIWYLWNKQRNISFVLLSVTITNFILSVLYLSGNQDSWWLLSYVCFAVYAGIGYFWLLEKLRYRWFAIIAVIISLAPLFMWWHALDRHDWNITEEYIHNLYTPVADNAILFGGAEPFVAASYYVHEVEKSTVIPVLNKVFYVYQPYYDNLTNTTDLKFPDRAAYLPYTAENYSRFVNDFFALNISDRKIYIDLPAYSTVFENMPGPNNSPSFQLDANRFKLVPSGLVSEVVAKDSNQQANINNFNYQFSNGFPKNKPTVIDKPTQEYLDKMILQYTLSYMTMGDELLLKKNGSGALNFYQKAYDFDPKNGAVLSKLGLLYLQAQQPTNALKYFEQGALEYPSDLNWQLSMGASYAMLGDRTQAVDLLQRVIQTSNDPQLQQKAAAILQQVQAQPVSN